MADAFSSMSITDIRDVSEVMTFATAATITSVACTLTDAAGTVTGGINGSAGTYVNAAGGTGSSTTWTVGYHALNPTSLSLIVGAFYNMKLVATRSDSEKFTAIVQIKITA